MNWKYADSTNTVVFMVHADGHVESQLTSNLPVGTLIAPADPITPDPDINKFQSDLKKVFGGIKGSNNLAKSYPLFSTVLIRNNWADLQELIIDAEATHQINPVQYAAIKTIILANNIPITLP